MKCPKCGYDRKKQDDELTPKTDCPSCGIIYAKFRQQLKKNENHHPAKDESEEIENNGNVTEEEKVGFSYKYAAIAALLIFCVFIYAGFSSDNGKSESHQVSKRTTTKTPKIKKEHPSVKATPEPPILKSREQFREDSKQICYKKWTKRGELDNRMYNHCMETQMDGYNELLQLHQYAEQSFYSGTSFPFCQNKWTKRGISDARMMAHCLQQEVEGIKDVMYYREQYGDEKVNQIAGYALSQFHSWNMAAYKVKQHFQ